MAQRVEVGGVTRVIKGSSAKATKGAPKSKRPGANNTPCRMRYWNSGKLIERKVQNLMRYNGLSRAEAEKLWWATRGASGNRMKR